MFASRAGVVGGWQPTSPHPAPPTPVAGTLSPADLAAVHLKGLGGSVARTAAAGASGAWHRCAHHNAGSAAQGERLGHSHTIHRDGDAG